MTAPSRGIKRLKNSLPRAGRSTYAKDSGHYRIETVRPVNANLGEHDQADDAGQVGRRPATGVGRESGDG